MCRRRAIFDAIIDQYPNIKERICSNAKIVHHSHFEQGVAKIREKNFKSLTQYELDALQCLKPKTVRDVEFVPGDLSLIERALKRRKIQSASASECMEAKFLVPASKFMWTAVFPYGLRVG